MRETITEDDDGLMFRVICIRHKNLLWSNNLVFSIIKRDALPNTFYLNRTSISLTLVISMA